MNSEDLKKAERAMLFAIKKHGAQRYGDQPYLTHLVQVVNVLASFGYSGDLTIVSAAWLHDVLEDTETTREELREAFGVPIEYAVWCVTSEIGRNRMDRLQSIVPKLLSSESALIVKLADRIANTEECSRNNPKLYRAYVKENAFFRECFYRRKTEKDIAPMWQRLMLAGNTDKVQSEVK